MTSLGKPQDEPGALPLSTKSLGLVYTFYSYKGGVGRSMALANTAVLMAQRGKKVLVVDMDLEAPGIERFFGGSSMKLSRPRRDTPGIVDLILAHAEKRAMSWRDCLVDVSFARRPLSSAGALKLITAGMSRDEDSRDYIRHLRELNWESLFEHGLGNLIEEWRSSWIKEFHFVLIDSRTGISDIGNICTILLPDVLVLVFTTSDQSVEGIANVMRLARTAQSRLPLSRGRLSAVPLLSRDEREKENDLSLEWRNKIAERLGEFYQDWLPRGTTPKDVLQKLYIPSVAYWSFGEKLPVVEKSEEIGDSRSIVASYGRLARLLEHQLDWTKIEGEEEAVKRAEQERRKADEERLRAERAEQERRKAEQELLRAQLRAERAVKDLQRASGPLVFSYLSLRRMVGAIAIALPFTLAVGNLFFQGPKILGPIGAYYYTPMRTVLVGGLITIGVLLMISRGYDNRDRIAGSLAGLFAIGTAIFPTAPEMAATLQQNFFARLHFLFMVSLFLTLAYISVFLFTRTSPEASFTGRKFQRNFVYRFCGQIMTVCVLVPGVTLLVAGETAVRGLTAFSIESLAFFAFGVSWLTKGEAILKDKEFQGEITRA